MNKVLTLGDVASIVDCEHKTAPISENGSYFAVGTPAMKGNLISFAEARRIDEGTFLEWTTRLRPVHGDLLLAREAPVGPVVRIPPAENVAPGQRTVLIRPDDNHVDGLFLFYLLISPMMQRRMGTLAAGSTVAHLNVADVRNLQLPPLPHPATQRGIGEVLGALDDKIAANQRVITTITDLTLTRYKQLSPRPGRRTLGEVTSIGGGATPSTKNPSLWDGDVAWATPTDVTGLPGDWITATERTISETGLISISSPLYPRGSILMTSRATIGAFALAAMPMTVNQGFIVLNAVDASLQMWLYAQLRSRVTEFKAWANGATFLELSKSVFKKLPFHEASMEDMLAFSRTAQPLLLRSEQAQKENTTLTAVRDELLPQLMSGRISVKDAEKRVEEEV